MPETAIHEDGFSKSRERQIGLAWKVFPVEAVPVAQAVNQPTHHHLWSGVLAMAPPHDFRRVVAE